MSSHSMPAQYYGTTENTPQSCRDTTMPDTHDGMFDGKHRSYISAPLAVKHGGRSLFYGVEEKSEITFMGAIVSVFAPWLLFTAIFGLLSSSLHYRMPEVVICFVAVAFILVAGSWCVAVCGGQRQKANHNADEESTMSTLLKQNWLRVLIMWLGLAWVAGCFFGLSNYNASVAPYFGIKSLQTYENVDVSSLPGIAAMDAGILTFKEGTSIDSSKGAAFRNDEIFCVAPLKRGDTAPESYDFWAVGKNCCSGFHGDFHCGDFANPRANAGIRVMRDVEAQFYQLAVKQASAEHGLRAEHPIFVTWMYNPMSKLERFQEAGWVYFQDGVGAYLIFQTIVVVFQVLVFFRLGYSWK